MRRAFGQMIVGNLASAFLGALIVISAARFLTPSLWASAAVIVGVGPALGVVLSLGSVSFHIRELAALPSSTQRRERVNLFHARRLLVALPIFILGIALLAMSISSAGWIFVLAAVRFVRGGAGVLFSSERRFGFLSVFLVAEKLTALLIVVVASLADVISIGIVAAAYVISYLTYIVLCMAIERTVMPRRVWSDAIRSPWGIWKGSSAFGVASLAGPAQQLDVSVVSLFVGPFEAGLFGSASRMIGGLNFAGSALASVVLPYFAMSSSRPKIIPVRLVLGGVLVVGMGVTTIIVFAPTWVPWLLGDAYSAAVGAICAYFLATVILTANQPMMAVLQALGDERFVMWIALCQSIAGLIAVGVGAALGGATGAALGYLLVVLFISVGLGLRVLPVGFSVHVFRGFRQRRRR